MTTSADHLPADLQRLLSSADAREAREVVLETWCPALRLKDLRAGTRALHPGCVGRLMGRTPEPPVLPLTASKLGGMPYLEEPTPRGGDADCTFVGQLNFGEFPTDGVGVPATGLLVVFIDYLGDWEYGSPIHYRWYPEPDERKAVRVETPRAVYRYECRVEASPAVSFDLGAVGATFPSRGWSDLQDQLCGWHGAFAGNSGCPWPHGLDGPGPRHWMGRSPPIGEHPTLIWTPAEAWICGSMSISLLAPPERAAAGDLSTLYVMHWQ